MEWIEVGTGEGGGWRRFMKPKTFDCYLLLNKWLRTWLGAERKAFNFFLWVLSAILRLFKQHFLLNWTGGGDKSGAGIQSADWPVSSPPPPPSIPSDATAPLQSAESTTPLRERERERERNDGCHRWLEPITSHIVTLYNAQSNDYTNNNSHQSGKSNRDDRILWHHWQRRLLLRFVSCFNAIQSLFPIQLTLMSFGMIVSTKFIFQFSDYRPPSMPNRAKTPRVDAWFKQSTPFTAPFRFMFYCNWIFIPDSIDADVV